MTGLDNSPTSERLAKAGDDVEDFISSDDHLTRRMLDGSILDRLWSRQTIDGDQYNAGVKYYKDWYLGGFAASGVVDATKPYVDGGDPMAGQTVRLHHANRFGKAAIAIGRVLSSIVGDAVLHEQPMDFLCHRYSKSTDRDRARADVITVMKLGLDALALHYFGPRGRRSHYHREDEATNRPDLREEDAA
jgi:hypothetical protein